ncbi:MAG: hypothetical protein MI754_05890 [Chromatiales bacterium]|nr:hypothetical protein [Chromatiales bacterium]
MLPINRQRLARISIGRLLVFSLVYGLAVFIVGIVCVVLLLILMQAEIDASLRLLGLVLIPTLFALYLFMALRIFKLFGGMFQEPYKTKK